MASGATVGGDTNRDNDVFLHDRQTATTNRVSVANDGTEAMRGGSERPAISAEAARVAFSSGAPNLAGGDTKTITRDVFVRGSDDGLTGPTDNATEATEHFVLTTTDLWRASPA